MSPRVITSTPDGSPTPIGPYSHIAKVGEWITIGGVAGVDPLTGELAGSDVGTQTRQILESLKNLLATVHSDLAHVVHVNVFMQDVRDFEEMNEAYAVVMGSNRPARTVIGVSALPKAGALLTMNCTAVVAE